MKKRARERSSQRRTLPIRIRPLLRALPIGGGVSPRSTGSERSRRKPRWGILRRREEGESPAAGRREKDDDRAALYYPFGSSSPCKFSSPEELNWAKTRLLHHVINCFQRKNSSYDPKSFKDGGRRSPPPRVRQTIAVTTIEHWN